ncbi:MAG: hypothetical protein ACRD3S_03435, partial [Terracidiphilus sp.]
MAKMPLRLQFARLLVVVIFVWPFVNVAYLYPGSTVEINFFFVFPAIALAPEALLDDKWTLLLLIPTVALAAALSSVGAGLRVIVGVIPLLFLMGLYRSFASRGWELIPRRIAYRALQGFVGFSVIQYINLNVFTIVPGWLTDGLTAIVPRYMTTPYDEFGIRGVQGWASEPSSAAMTCFAFAIVAVLQEPEKRWRILCLFSAMAVFNKSIYAVALLALLGIALLFEAKNKMISVLALLPLTVGITYFLFRSGRVVELQNAILIYGLSEVSSPQFLRVGQIIYPLTAFPHIYKPVDLFGFAMEPLGLLPLLVGYGSLFGCVIYCRAILAPFRSNGAKSMTLALTSAFVFSFVISPDFVPLIVSFAYAIKPRPSESMARNELRGRWLGRLIT